MTRRRRWASHSRLPGGEGAEGAEDMSQWCDTAPLPLFLHIATQDPSFWAKLAPGINPSHIPTAPIWTETWKTWSSPDTASSPLRASGKLWCDVAGRQGTRGLGHAAFPLLGLEASLLQWFQDGWSSVGTTYTF